MNQHQILTAVARRLALLVAVHALSGCGKRAASDGGDIETTAHPLRGDAVSAVTLTQHQGDFILVTRLSEIGSVTTVYGDQATKTPVRGGSFKYASRAVLALDYERRTLVSTTLDAAVTSHKSHLQDHRDLATNTGRAEPPEVPLRATRLRQRIAGLHARAYSTTIGDSPARLWYTDDLPEPPSATRRQLRQLAETSLTMPDRPRSDDRHICGDDDDDKPLSSVDVAGKVLLRMQLRKDGGWQTQLDTGEAVRSTMSPGDFVPPSGWTDETQVLRAGSPSAPAQQLGPSASLQSTSAPQALAASSGPDVSNASPPISIVTSLGGGPWLSRVEVHAVYWGESFADPAHAAAVTELDNAIATSVGEASFGRLAEYGILPGKLKSSVVVPSRPPPSVLQDFFTLFPTEAFVSWVMSQYGPMFWWKTGPNPLIAVLVNSDEVGRTASFSGYHLDYITPAFLLPFPVNLFANDFMPFALSSMKGSALELPAGALAARDTCGSFPTPPGCEFISAFDHATETLSHEIVEAVTDPYPFNGFVDPSKFPVWSKGEIADICSGGPYSSTRVGDYVLATLWSNTRLDCVGDYRASVHLIAPRGHVPRTLTVPALATGSAAINRGSQLIFHWFLDHSDVSSGAGRSSNLYFGTDGPHHVQVVVKDANGYQASDEADIVIDPMCDPAFGQSCGSCGGTVLCDGSCSKSTPPDLGGTCGSCGGTVRCDGSCSVVDPIDLGQTCGCGGTVQCGGACSALCDLTVNFSNIDDDAYVWFAVPGFNSDPANAICKIRGSSGSCDLGAFMRSEGIEWQNFIVKIGNSGCANSHGDISFVMGGNEVWHGHKGDTGLFTHCGWTYRAALTADLRAASVNPIAENFCVNVTDCPF
jgi:hypothetical protein